MKKQESAPFLRELESRREENFDLFRRYINPGFVDLLRLVGFGRRFVRAKGAYLTDESGVDHLDMVAGYGTHSLGHNHPEVQQALKQMLDSDLPGYSQLECSLPAGLAAEHLCQRLPENLDRVFWCSSGSEAVEAAIKLARAATGRKRLVYFDGAFHGTTTGALSLMGQADRRDRFGPLLADVVRLPIDDLPALERTLSEGDVAGVVVEPVQGEGGARVLNKDFLKGMRGCCHNHGALLIADEVQSGLGRTGRWFAFEHSGICPDAVCLAKALGAGLVPVGAMVADGELFDKAYGSLRASLDHKTTFSGGPLAMTAVATGLAITGRDDLPARAARLGRHLRRGLDKLAARHKQIASVSGIGLLQGIRFQGVDTGLLGRKLLGRLSAPSSELYAQYVSLRLLNDHQILAQVAACDLSVLKVSPPLTIARKELDRFTEALDQILAEGGHAKAWLHMADKLIRNRAK